MKKSVNFKQCINGGSFDCELKVFTVTFKDEETLGILDLAKKKAGFKTGKVSFAEEYYEHLNEFVLGKIEKEIGSKEVVTLDIQYSMQTIENFDLLVANVVLKLKK
jgi:hypothetical protein